MAEVSSLGLKLGMEMKEQQCYPDAEDMSTPMQPEDDPLLITRINTRSANNVVKWIKKGVAEGRLKRCWNLDVKMFTKLGYRDDDDRSKPEVDLGLSYFAPSCRYQSFEWAKTYNAMDDKVQQTLLENFLDSNPICCPKDCVYYRSKRWVGIRQKTGDILTTVYKALTGLLKGFAALPWPTQVALVVGIVLAISPQWAPLLVSLVKALK
jgi:hypothetical protein